MSLDWFKPDFYELAYNDLCRRFGQKYANSFKEVMNQGDSQTVFLLKHLCPYCCENPNYRACGQCYGRGEVESVNFSESARFIGVTPIKSNR